MSMWHEGNPKDQADGCYFVRIEENYFGFTRVHFKIHYWHGYTWARLSPYDYGNGVITHYAYIDDPVPFDPHNMQYADILGRMECVAQRDRLPNLQTAPAGSCEKTKK